MSIKTIIDKIKIDYEKFQEIDQKRVDLWPKSVQIFSWVFVFLLIFGVCYFSFGIEGMDEVANEQAKETELKNDFSQKKQQMQNLDKIIAKQNYLKEAYSDTLKQMPEKTQMQELLNDINQSGIGRGLKFNLFRPLPEEHENIFSIQQIEIEVEGQYEDIAYFISDIANLKRVVTLGQMSLKIEDTKNNKVKLNAKIKTYRYLDSAELAETREKEKKAKTK